MRGIFFRFIFTWAVVSGQSNTARVAPIIVVHGGAGNITKDNLTEEAERERRNALLQSLRAGYAILEGGGNAIDAVVAAITILEDSPWFNAGRGSVLNESGYVQMDASIMYGPTMEGGAVAAVERIKNPIKAALMVMQKTKHVLLVGPHADSFAQKNGLELMPREYFIVEQSQKEKKGETVGAVAMDIYGNICAGTSTGGLRNKMEGRVGDTPLLGAGTYATKSVGISCTGIGEYFIRVSAAARVAFLVESGKRLEEAVGTVLHMIKQMGGRGGIIAVDSSGNYVMMFNSKGMYRGVKGGKASIEKVMIFDNEE